MPRAERIQPDVYIGRPGALVKVPWPRGDMSKPLDKLVYEFVTASGQRQVSQLVGGTRLYTVNWNAFHTDTFSILERFWSGSAGAGPWVFVDPSMKNMLLPNQAAATSVFYDTRQWATQTGAANEGELISNAAAVGLHTYNARSLRWLFSSAAATTPGLGLTTPYRNWYGFPVVPGMSYAWSAWCRPDGTVDSNITLRVVLQWLNASGVWQSEVSSGDTALTGWQRLSAVGVAPVGAVYAKPMFFATGSTITTGGSLYIDEPMLEQDTVVNDWAPGSGLRPVEIMSLDETVPFDARFRKGISMTLRELAP